MTQRLSGQSSLSREERVVEYLEIGLTLQQMADKEGINYASMQKWLNADD